MNNELLQLAGLTPEVLQDRVVDGIVKNILSSARYDEYGDLYDFEGSSKFRDTILNEARKKIDKAVEDLATRVVEPITAEAVENIKLQATNKWGEKKGEEVTFREYLISQAERYLNEPVDYSGKPKGQGDYNFSPKQTRVAHLVHSMLYVQIESTMREALKNANNSIAKGIHETVKIQLKEISDKLKVEVRV